MTDRTITLTPTEAEKFKALAVGESMWIVREGADCTLGDHCYAAHDDNAQHPPVEFVQACAPCDACDDLREDCRIELVGPCPNCNGDGWWVDADPDPRTGEPGEPYQVFCQQCGEEGDGAGTVTLGYAYAIGQPLPIVGGEGLIGGTAHILVQGSVAFLVSAINGKWAYTDVTDALAHYGPPESLVGQWAIEVRRG